MATESIKIENELLVNGGRVFLPSSTINVFPCSRRGQENLIEGFNYYDPEARLNTERTNRLHTSVNGFKDSFIVTKDFTTDGTLIFVLAGYYIEAKTFNPNSIASALGEGTTMIYAYLSLHNNVSLGVDGYFTEMLQRQSGSSNDVNYLDVSYSHGENSNYFFVGVSFTKEPIADAATEYNLPLFSYVDGEWELVQTSLLPKIEHGETDDSVKISGDFTVKHGEQTSFKVTENETVLGPTEISKLTVTADTTLEKGLTVASGDTSVQKLLVNSDLEVKGSTATPTLKTNNITSNSDVITVDKKLTLSTNTSITAPVANVHSTLNVTNSEKNAKADVDELVADKATIGDLVVKADPGLNNSTGNITTPNFQATSNATIYDLDVDTNIDTSTLKATTSITAPQLNTDKITGDNTEIVVDKVLKVDTINSDATNGLTVKRKLTAEKDIVVTADNEVNTPQLRVDRITSSNPNNTITIDNKKLVVNRSLEMLAKEEATAPAKATIEQAVIGDLTVKQDASLKDSTGIIAADTLKQKVDNTYYNVPIVFLQQLDSADSNVYQLQISRANILPYQNN